MKHSQFTIEFHTEQDDAGKTVFAWFVIGNGGKTLAGGYGATLADARNDAATWIRDFHP